MKQPIICAALAAAIALPATLMAEEIVILHTNDTHSQIDPDDKGRGGVLRRAAVIDSVRRSRPDVLVVDAGDAVQGTPYFTLFGGRVEQELLNRQGYDVQILGNHEFDNGVKALAANYRNATPSVISTNNSFTGTELEPLIKPYVVKQVGNRRIGFIGINIDPHGLVDMSRCQGVVYVDAVDAANRMAAFLRDSAKVDAVVAISHIGFAKNPDTPGYTDPQLAGLTRGIDVIIGGHSHTNLQPGSPLTRVANADGDTVLIVQNANSGRYIGEVVLDFNNDTLASTDWHKFAIGKHSEANGIDPALVDYLRPYKAQVDSVMAIEIGRLEGTFDDAAMINFASDYVRRSAARLNGGRLPDLAIMNKGGIRTNFNSDKMTVGGVLLVFPFDNRISLVDLKGSDLRELMDIMARQQGNGVSTNVNAVMAPDFSRCVEVTIDGKPIDDNRTYRVATIDYLLGGNDNMTPLTRAKLLKKSNDWLYDDMIDAFRNGFFKNRVVKADSTPHMLLQGNPSFQIKCH